MKAPRGRSATLALLAVGMLALAGCGAPAQAPPSPAASAVAQPPPGTLALVGALRNPRPELTTAQLGTMPTQTLTVSFGTSKGTETHTETGVPLLTLLNDAGLALDPARKHDELNFVVLAVGADGYSAAVAVGELSPEGGNRQSLVALTQDGTALARPRLVVVGDVKGARAVSDLVRLQVVRPAPN